MATLAPSRANRTAIACPMPDDAPVINTFLPFRRSIVCSCEFGLHLLDPRGASDYSALVAGIFLRVPWIEGRMNITRRLILTVAMVAAVPVFAESKSNSINRDGSGVAIKGYDPVAYFTQNKPVKGSSAFSYQWMNSTWWFATAEDRDEFTRTPEKYAPQYGGYCAYGVSQ